ncbi:MAG: ATP-binding protein [Caulobacterales bacterium]
MTEYSVTAQADHISKITAVRKPILAVAELAWNAFDADATRVDITIEPDDLGGLRAIEVSDNGWGMTPDQAHKSFSGLGGSWKKLTTQTSYEKRQIHGKEGQGRFKSLALGRVVDWIVIYPEADALLKFQITIVADRANKFELSEPQPAGAGDTRGVRVRISEIERALPSLTRDRAVDELSQVFALYLRKYQNAKLFFEQTPVDPAAVEDRAEEYPLAPIKLFDGRTFPAQLEVVEWKVQADRRLYLCTQDGFPLDEMQPGIQAPRFNFTAYLKSEAIAVLANEGVTGLGELDGVTTPAIDEAKRILRDHFRARAAEEARGLVDQWKEENVYPYRGEPKTTAEVVERQVFNIAALNVNAFLPKFAEADPKAKQLQLRLLRHAIETGPDDALRFLMEALELPVERRQELAELLDKTTLADMISATKVITDRLELLQGLDELIFASDLQKVVKERAQLHRVLAPNAWIFGEQYHIAADDQNLTNVLRKHLALIGEDVVVDDPVKRTDGSDGVVDLMLSRCIMRPGTAEREHLIVELKRPSVDIGLAEANQIESYAMAVIDDPRFKDTRTRWVFWAIAKDIKPDVRRRAAQANRPAGILYQDAEGRVTVWVKTWAEVLEDARARMRFFQDMLGYTPDRDASREHLKKAYAKHVGELFAKPEPTESGDGPLVGPERVT